MTKKACPAVAAAVLGAVLAAPGDSQAPKPGEAPAETKPAAGLSQPAEFVKLAAKAKQLRSCHVTGTCRVQAGEGLKELPPERRNVGFEMWVAPPAAKVVWAEGVKDVCVSDGTYSYALRHGPDGKPQWRRRRVTPQNCYHVLDLAGVYCDAADGYRNLRAGVKLHPAAAPPEHASRAGRLRWFRLEPATDPPHHLLAGTEEVQMGIAPEDGLVRVLLARKKFPTRTGHAPVVVTVLFEKLVHRKLAPQELLLPPAAAEGKWIDADTRKPISPPLALIAKKAP